MEALGQAFIIKQIILIMEGAHSSLTHSIVRPHLLAMRLPQLLLQIHSL